MARRKKSPSKSSTYKDIAGATARFPDVPVPRKDPSKPFKAIKRESPINRRLPTVAGYGKPTRGRRVFEPYGVEDPNEARAVPESVFPGTILERIVYKRSLYLYGPEGRNWTTQETKLRGVGNVGNVRLDFVYYLSDPPLALEPQGAFWHDRTAAYSDAARAFQIIGLGFRYAEIFEYEVLHFGDVWLDQTIRDLVGGTVATYLEQFLTHQPLVLGTVRTANPFKEGQRAFGFTG